MKYVISDHLLRALEAQGIVANDVSRVELILDPTGAAELVTTSLVGPELLVALGKIGEDMIELGELAELERKREKALDAGLTFDERRRLEELTRARRDR